MTLEKKILKILEKYTYNSVDWASQDIAKEIALFIREELIKYDRAYWGPMGDSEKNVDEYLKQKGLPL